MSSISGWVLRTIPHDIFRARVVSGVQLPMTHEEHEEAFIRLMSSCQKRLFLYLRVAVFSGFGRGDAPGYERHPLAEAGGVRAGNKLRRLGVPSGFFRGVPVCRDRRRNLPVFSDVFLTDFAPELLAAAEVSDSLETKLEDCIKELNVRDREMLERRYASGSNTRAVAASMGCSTDAVYRALRRIHESLFDCITGKLREEDRG